MMAEDRWTKPVLVGALVTLRPIVAEDAEPMWEMAQDPEGNDLTATTELPTEEQIAEWCRSRVNAVDRLDLAIIESRDRSWAGEVVINDYDEQTESANFRMSLRGARWFGRGLGTEATRLVLDHAFSTIGLRRVVLDVLARNPRARRVYEKAGFREVRTFIEAGETWVEMAVEADS